LGNAIKTISEQDFDTVDAASLGAQTKAPSYLADQLNKILQHDACAPGEESPRKIIIVVSRSVRFARHARIPKIVFPQSSASTQLFYVQDNEAQDKHDDLYEMLRSLNPMHYVMGDRSSFLKALNILISEIAKPAVGK
jgi:hypothetical protein